MKIISLVLQNDDGDLITMNPAGTLEPVTNEIEYASDGWSVEMREGCLRNKEVDDVLLAMSTGNEYEREVAKNAPVWFGNFVDGREYTEEQKLLLRRNYQQDNASPTFASGWLGMVMFQEFYGQILRDAEDNVAPFTYLYQERRFDAVTAISGFNPYAAHLKIAEAYINNLYRDAKHLQFLAETPNAPQPSPTKPK